MRGFRITLALSLVAGMALTAPAHAGGSGSISGTVTNEAGLPLAGICVQAGISESFNRGSDETGSDGSYSITGLVDGEYAIVFRDCAGDIEYVTEWYEGQRSYYSADLVAVSGGAAVEGVDVALALGGFVSGTLIDDDGNPAATCVVAYAERDGWVDIEATAYTNFDDGTYRVGPLPSGNVQLQFGNCDAYVPIERWTFPYGVVIGITPVPRVVPQGYVREWYDDKAGYGGDSIPILAGIKTAGVDATLAIAGGVVGTVTDETGRPLENICVDASDNEFHFGWSTTDENGSYEIDELAPGLYKVAFSDCNGSEYRYEWYDNQSSYLLADTVTVVRKEWTKHINAALARRPRPDLAIAKLKVSSVPLEVADTKVAGSPFLRTVEVDVANLGTATPTDEATLFVFAISESDGAVQSIAGDDAFVAAGETEHRKYDWNGLGTIGDVRIYAGVCTYDDRNRNNDEASTRSYVGVGGLGLGFRPGGGNPPFDFHCGPGVIIVNGIVFQR